MAEENNNISGSFSFDVTKRILDVLGEAGPVKKTNLAIKTGLNYNVCIRYVNMLKTLGWLEIKSGGRWDHVSITNLGRQVSRKLLPGPQKAGGSSIEAQKAVSEVRPGPAAGPVRKSDEMAKVMVVDDEQDVALTYESFLTSNGYKASVFSGAYDALRDFASKPFHYDLAILDIRMPDMNGLQLYQSFKAMNPGCKIMFVSSLDAAEELASILPGVRPQDVVRKPVDREHFIKAVRAALGC
jgi:CheY-like chemotaxis protein/predicted transcriptional regulator